MGAGQLVGDGAAPLGVCAGGRALGHRIFTVGIRVWRVVILRRGSMPKINEKAKIEAGKS